MSLTLLLAAALATADGPYEITYKDGGFEVAGLDERVLATLTKRGIDSLGGRLPAFFGVYVGDQGPDRGVPAMTGTWQVVGKQVRFTPQFPLQPGQTYKVVVNVQGLSDQLPGPVGLTKSFTLAAKPLPPAAAVLAIYPSADVLPENQLRFYVTFSGPMSRGEAYDHVRLLDAQGKVVADPFLELGEELWNRDCTRFTLLIDPGRIKRGLKPREEVGPVLEAGKGYTLVVDAAWPDAHGRPLKDGARKAFKVGPAAESSPDPAAWKLAAPAPAARTPLEVRFPAPLDRGMLERVLEVHDAAGRKVPGVIAIADAERTWRFTPERPWAAGGYHLVVDTTLEDLAGNSIARPFDVDVTGPIQKAVPTSTVKVAFQVGAPGK